MELKAKRIYEFGPFRLDTTELVLLRNGNPVYLKPKVLETLLVLVENAGRILDKESLMKRLWQDTFVEESNLAVNISQLRKVLGQTENGPQFIETLPRRGYRFTAEVRELCGEEAALVIREFTQSRITIEEQERIIDHDAITVRSNTVTGEMAPAGMGKFRLARLEFKKALAVGTVTVVSVILLSGWLLLNRTRAPEFRNIRIDALPNTGNSVGMAISPDGKFLAHVVLQDGRRSLRLRQLATGSDVQLIPPGEAFYDRLMFSRDGNNIYYLSRSAKDSVQSIYVMPAFGGATKKLIEGAFHFTLSPDNSRVAFLRNNKTESSLIIFSPEGKEENTLASVAKPDSFLHAAWSPDNDLIACTVATYQGAKRSAEIVGFRVKDGVQSAIARQWERVYGLEWISDGSGLILSGLGTEPSSTLWLVSYPAGEVRRITNDAETYSDFTLSADSGTLVCSKTEIQHDLWLVPVRDPDQAHPITKGASSYLEPSLTPDGRVVFVSRASGNADICIMDMTAANQKQLTVNDATDRSPEVSADGNFIVFLSGEQIWRMSIDGSGLKQLTHGNRDRSPRLSPDGKWLAYTTLSDSDSTLWRTTSEGEEPTRLSTRPFYCPAFSPDGKYLACVERSGGVPPALTIMTFPGGQQTRAISLPKTALPVKLHWLPDASGIAYVDHRNGASNVWVQPLDGGAPTQLTAFASDQINDFGMSRDGTQLVVSRGSFRYKLVMVTDREMR